MDYVGGERVGRSRSTLTVHGVGYALLARIGRRRDVVPFGLVMTELGFRMGVLRADINFVSRRVMKARGIRVYRVFKKLWIPLLLVVVVTLGGYVVVRVRASFGANANASAADANGDDTKPFHPKHITYEVTAPSSGSVSVNYLDEDGQPHLVENAPLPWSHTIVTTLPSMSANIVAQGDVSISQIRCRIIVDGQVRDDRSIDQYEPFIYCLVKSV